MMIAQNLPPYPNVLDCAIVIVSNFIDLCMHQN